MHETTIPGCLASERVKNFYNFQVNMSAIPVQIVQTEEDHTFTLDDEALAEILNKNDVKDRAVVVVSVAGAFRKGKSFILDFFLRYLYAKVSLFRY